jgi:DNA-binding GntR family transcriptional regulator
MNNIPQLNSDGYVPVYIQIADWMREQIRSENWLVGKKITPENELAQNLNVSRGTVRSAIEQLIDAGLLVRSHGRGTYVAAPVMAQPLTTGFITIAEDLNKKEIPFITEVLQQKIIVPPDDVKAGLQILDNEKVFFLERVRVVNNCRVYYLRNYVAINRCEGIQKQDFTKNRLFSVLENIYNLELDWGRREIMARSAGEEIADVLDISKSYPVMYLNQQTFLRDHHPIEYSHVWIRGDCIRLVADLQRNAKESTGSTKLDFNMPELCS